MLTYVCNACYAVHWPLQALQGCGRELKKDAREAAFAGLVIAPLWFLAQWTYAAGVATTSVTASTVISTTSVVWTMLGSVLVLRERLTAPWHFFFSSKRRLLRP